MKTAIIWSFVTLLLLFYGVSFFWKLPVIVNIWIGKIVDALMGMGGIWIAIYIVRGIFGQTSDRSIPEHPVFASVAILIFTLISLFLFSKIYSFALDGFGKKIIKETKTLKGGIIDAAFYLRFDVEDARTQDTYEFGINDPVAKDLLLLFEKYKKFGMSNYRSTDRSMEYEVQYLWHSGIILSAKLIDSK